MRLSISLFALLVAVAPFAEASKISLQGNGVLDPFGDTLTLLLSGTDYYTTADLHITINGGIGPAPVITAIFGTGSHVIPHGNFAGSIWAQGGNGSLGLASEAVFSTENDVPQNSAGVFATFFLNTSAGLGGPPFTISFAGSALYNGLDANLDPVLVPLDAPDIILSTVLTWTNLVPSLSPGTSISLGSVAPSTGATAPAAITLTNRSQYAAPLTVETATLTGPDASLFEIIGGFSPTTLLGDGSADFGVRFLGAPNAGTYTAQLQFTFLGATNPGLISYPFTITVVPEPSSYALAAVGAIALVAVRRRKALAWSLSQLNRGTRVGSG